MITQTLSIGRRLTLLLGAIAALLAFLSWGMVSSFSGQAAARTQDNVLAASVSTIAETVRREQGTVRLELPYSAFAMLGAISEDRVFYRVSVAGETLTGYDDLRGGRIPEAPGEVLFDTLEYRGETVRMASISRVVLAGREGASVTVSVAQTRNGIAAVTAGLSRTAAVLSVAFFVLAAALSAIAARASLRPLNEIAQSVSRRGPSDLRPIRRPAPSELAPLMTALTRLMDRLGQSIRRSEDFITEAAHRVRTPLATVRAQAEIALH
ncbi:MAG: sensor histidine kinase N-terminal domain-containing protein, partial [Paracoccaceae bacterium]|nr:sensor histidine kinase N-terminal domain-containing protein [Paracoccaceae bacterium]